MPMSSQDGHSAWMAAHYRERDDRDERVFLRSGAIVANDTSPRPSHQGSSLTPSSGLSEYVQPQQGVPTLPSQTQPDPGFEPPPYAGDRQSTPEPPSYSQPPTNEAALVSPHRCKLTCGHFLNYSTSLL
jgi:hypothetical protein